MAAAAARPGAPADPEAVVAIPARHPPPAAGAAVGGLWVLYLTSLEKNPILTKCVTSGILNAAGDLFAQFMFEGAA